MNGYSDPKSLISGLFGKRGPGISNHSNSNEELFFVGGEFEVKHENTVYQS